MNVIEIAVFRPACETSSEMVSARVFLDRDLTELLPYVKGVVDNAQYFPKGSFIRFKLKDHLVIVDHDHVACAGFPHDEAARAFALEVIEFLKDIESRKGVITPNSTPFKPPTVMEIFKLLPRKSACGKCGYPTCMAFAAALVKDETAPRKCADIAGETGDQTAIDRLEAMLRG